MHDIVDLEARGLRGVFVATAEFTAAAAHQAQALGAEPAAVYVAHPIQDRTDAEMVAIADRVADRLIGELVAGASRE